MRLRNDEFCPYSPLAVPVVVVKKNVHFASALSVSKILTMRGDSRTAFASRNAEVAEPKIKEQGGNWAIWHEAFSDWVQLF
jgi:hypothetical protein